MTNIFISTAGFFLAIILLAAEPGAFEEKAGKSSWQVEANPEFGRLQDKGGNG